MKKDRQRVIRELVQNTAVETQEELTQALLEHGFSVTQATVSRDIREMRLLKVLSADGQYKYALPQTTDHGMNDRFIRILKESVMLVTVSETLIVIKTLNGSANAAAEALDSMHWPEVLGSIAGDNTIFMAVASREDAEVIREKILELAHGAD